VRLKRLELAGFKTFAERTVLEFASRITAIVGPNGSGKSNVFDAVRWALGEGNVRSLRGARTEDIIFAGTERRRPLAMAEVTLTLDNEDGALVLPADPDDRDAPPTPLAFAEVTVTRRAMRSAESQYFINGLPCRLRDIQMMFLGTGLGGHTYALISQGEVEQMLDATPDERRMILEEAAGLAKYKRRRHDAERRMAAAAATLVRVGDVLRELDAQTVQLAAQAEAAERYQAQTRELRTLELSLQVEEVRRGLRAERRVRDQLAEIGARRQALDAALRALEEQRAAVERRAAAAAGEWEEIQRRRVGLVERRAAADAAVRLLAERLRGLEARRERVARDLAGARAEAAALAGERERLAAEAHEAAARAADAGAAMQAADADLRRAESEASCGEEELEAAQAAARSAAEERTALQNAAAAAEAREAAHREQTAERARRLEELRAAQDGIQAERDRLAEQCGRDETALEERRSLAGTLARERDECARARDALLADERRLDIEREGCAARVRFLEEAQAGYRGYDAAAREILLAWRAHPERVPGLRGAVADALTVARDLRPAVEAALGPALSALIVATVEDARAALDLLDGAPRGAVTFLPLSQVARDPAPDLPPAVAADPDTVGRAADLATVAGPDPDAIAALLADVVIVRDLDAALRARAAGYRGRIATLAGEVVAPGGLLVAGRPLPERGGILGRGEEIDEARGALARAHGAAGELARRRAALEDRLAALARTLAAAEAEEAAGRDAVDGARRQLAVLDAELARGAAQAEALEAERAAGHRAAEAQRAQVEELTRQVAGCRARAAAAEARMREVAGGLRERAAARDRALAQIADLRVRLTELAAQAAAHRDRVREVERQSGQLEIRCRDLSAELAQLDAEAGALRADQETRRQHCAAIDADSAALASAQAALEEDRRRVAARQAELAAEHDGALARGAALSEEAHRAELRAAQIEAELASARRRIEEEFGVAFDRAAEAVPSAVPREETLARLEALRAQIAAMGPVNLLAIEEHQQVSARARALREQQEDAQGAIAALRGLIVQLEDVIRGQFEKTYDAVNAQFGDLFVRLFGGGRAGLERVPGEDGAEPGIDIVAQPPGKKLRSLGALSGGERVLVALALVFAMLQVRPSPFCVFDEVEAALDESNTRKVGEVLRELSRRSQIIIITHNKATMEASDALFGVTMEEAGVSQVVSLRLTGAAAAEAEPQPVG
jgi:chromosome segregation protein